MPCSLWTLSATSVSIIYIPGQHMASKLRILIYLLLTNFLISTLQLLYLTWSLTLTNVIYRVNRMSSLKFLCESNQTMFSFFQNMSLAFNICLCYDLMRTLKDPFSPGARRLKFYMMFSLVFAATFAWFSERDISCKFKIGIQEDDQLLMYS